MREPTKIEIGAISPVVDRRYTKPVKDELEKLYPTTVSLSESEHEPPAAGLSEIAVIIGVTAPLVYKFFEPLVTSAGESFRDKVMELIKHARKSKVSGRVYIPLLIKLGTESDPAFPHGPVRYFFHGEVDPEELLERLQAADQHVRGLPPDVFQWHGGPPEYGYFWDSDHGAWRGCVWNSSTEQWGEFWLPPNILSDEDEYEISKQAIAAEDRELARLLWRVRSDARNDPGDRD